MQEAHPIDKRKPVDPQQVPRRGLVDRVASSRAFQKSNRLRDLFLFLCERALSDPGGVVREQQIGVEVFGRQADYDTSQDTLARVHVSQLRKKLQQYFASEGQHEPVVIEIPTGGYTPVFHSRQSESLEDRLLDVQEEPSRPKANRLTLLFALLAAVACASTAWLAFRPVDFQRLVRPGSEPTPTLDRLWHQMLANGRQTCVVLSDSNLTLFADLIQRQVGLREYTQREFASLADELVKDPEQKAMAKTLMTKLFTHIADANVAGKIRALNAARQVPTEVLFARDLSMSYLQSQNVVLLGSRRANPWLELFENQLNFRSGFQEQPPLAYFQNHSPLPGEPPAYRADWGRQGYCRVAFLPNLTRSGNILVISGTDLASTDAGGEFISSERWIQALCPTLGLTGRARFPYFEVLLRVQLSVVAPRLDIVAHRISKM